MKSDLRFDHSDLTRIRVINRASEGSNNTNDSSTTRGGTVAKPADRVIWANIAYRETSRCTKQNRRSDAQARYRFKGSVLRSASERVGAFRYEGRTRHGAARRIAGWAILPRVLLGTRQVKPRRVDPRDIALELIIAPANDEDERWRRFAIYGSGPRFNGVLRLAVWFMAEQAYAMSDPAREDNRFGGQDRSYRKSPTASNPISRRGGIIVDKRRALWGSVINYNDINYEIH